MEPFCKKVGKTWIVPALVAARIAFPVKDWTAEDETKSEAKSTDEPPSAPLVPSPSGERVREEEFGRVVIGGTVEILKDWIERDLIRPISSPEGIVYSRDEILQVVEELGGEVVISEEEDETGRIRRRQLGQF